MAGRDGFYISALPWDVHKDLRPKMAGLPGCYTWAMKKGPWLFVGYIGDEILPRYVVIIINHNEDPGSLLYKQPVFQWISCSAGFLGVSTAENDDHLPVLNWNLWMFVLHGLGLQKPFNFEGQTSNTKQGSLSKGSRNRSMRDGQKGWWRILHVSALLSWKVSNNIWSNYSDLTRPISPKR